MSEPTITLKPEPDGMGYLYGTLNLPDGTTMRLDVLPPAPAWRGTIQPAEIDPTQWIIYAEGEEVARVARQQDIIAILQQRFAGNG